MDSGGRQLDGSFVGRRRLRHSRNDWDHAAASCFFIPANNAPCRSDALKAAEANAKPQLQALLLRVQAAKSAEEMTRLTQETAEALGRSDEASTWRDRWNIVKRLFGK